MMNRKKMIATVAVAFGLFIVFCMIFILCRYGVFDKYTTTDIASFSSPDGRYRLEYQQRGDPEFPFGKTYVRFILYDNGKQKTSVDTFISDDGAIANEHNIKSIDWRNESVSVVLQASEMDDKEIVIAYNGNP